MSVEWAPDMVVGTPRLSFARALLRSLRRLMKYWADKEQGRGPLTPGDVKAIRDAPSTRLRSRPVSTVCTPTTRTRRSNRSPRRSTASSTATESNERILCDGGAGTGKTFLTAEELHDGRPPPAIGCSLTCSSEILAGFLRGAAQTSPATTATSRRSTDCGLLRLTAGSTRSSSTRVRTSSTFDDLAVLDSLLVGGLADGRWRMFYDPTTRPVSSATSTPRRGSFLSPHHRCGCIFSTTAATPGGGARRSTRPSRPTSASVLPARASPSRGDSGRRRQEEAQIVTDHLERLERASVDPAESRDPGGPHDRRLLRGLLAPHSVIASNR